MDNTIERLRSRWVVVALVTAAAALAIQVSEPDYVKLQTADGAAEFVRLLDHPGRAMLGAAFDMVFSVAYCLLGLIGLRAHGGGTRIARWAAAAIVFGAASDEIENGFVLANVARRDTLTDSWIDAMQVPGTTKWALIPGFVVLLGLIGRSALRRSGEPS